MRTKLSVVSLSLITCLLMVVGLSSCKKDPCVTEVCLPCPSSRFVMAYQDTTGNCVPSFHASAWVHAIDNETSDTLYTYNFSDSCEVGFIVDVAVTYHVIGGNPVQHDVITFEEIEYQEPINITECCLCYPVDHIHGMLNAQELSVSFKPGDYVNEPFVRTID